MSYLGTERIGRQTPVIESIPLGSVSSAGHETIALAKRAGLILDPWQCHILNNSLGENKSGNWTSFEVGVIVSRQNGKGSVIEARELAGLFLFNEELILHSAHEFKTASQAFKRIRGLIENTPVLKKKVKSIKTGSYEQSIELITGQRLQFIARSGGSGRGFSADTIILDEAYNLPDSAIDALMPTTSARPNPQIWYTSSAPDIDLAPCEQLGAVRKRAIEGGDPSLSFFEWSADVHDADCLPDCDKHEEEDDPEVWYKTNPALGIRLSPEHVQREKRSMTKSGFRRERLGVGNYPADSEQWRVLTEAQWKATEDLESKISVASSIVLAVDVTPDSTYGTIAVAGLRDDGIQHFQLVAHKPGTAWIVPKLKELKKSRKPSAILIMPTSQAGSLISKLESLDIEITKPSGIEYAQACGHFYSGVKQKEMFHPQQNELDLAVAGALKKQYGTGGSWIWSRKGTSAIISPLITATLASWGHVSFGTAKAVTPWISWD